MRRAEARMDRRGPGEEQPVARHREIGARPGQNDAVQRAERRDATTIADIIAAPPRPSTASAASAATRVDDAILSGVQHVEIRGVERDVARRDDQHADEQRARNRALRDRASPRRRTSPCASRRTRTGRRRRRAETERT